VPTIEAALAVRRLRGEPADLVRIVEHRHKIEIGC
jgi:hypothetical protein